MPPTIQRFCLRAIPLSHNRRYRPYETAHIAVFVRQEDRLSGEKRLHEVLARERWRMIELQIHDRLDPERIAEEGGDVLAAYEHAIRHGDFVKIFPDHFGAGRKNEPATRAPKLSEAFMDRVVQVAGGSRYQPPGPEHARKSNADYRIDDFVVELKDIEENALAKPSRQKRLAELMRQAGCDQAAVPLDLALIKDPVDRRDFLRIIGEPINKALSDSADQIRETRKIIGDPALRGAVFLINSGTHFYDHELFVALTRHFAAKPGRSIDDLLCFTCAMHTNGFDHRVQFATYPHRPMNALQGRILKAFEQETQNLMSEWMQSGMQSAGPVLQPHEALGFDYDGQTFYWLPERLPSSLGLG